MVIVGVVKIDFYFFWAYNANSCINYQKEAMCEAIVFLTTRGTEREIMRDVLTLEDQGNYLVLTSLLGTQRELQAKVKSIDFMQHKVILEEI